MAPNMLLPSIYLDTEYMRYKLDVDFVSLWLISEADRLGFDDDMLLNRAAHGSAAIQQFIAFADFIARSAHPPMQVPPRIIHRLDRAISETWSIHLSAYKGTSGGDGKQCYYNFRDVLEHVRDALKPFFATHVSSLGVSEGSAQTGRNVQALQSSVASLDMHVRSRIGSQRSGNQRAQRVMPEWGSKAERFLLHEVDLQELRLLLEDFQNIRITVQTLWKSYKRSAKEDLVSLAITINTAIETARRMEERAELALQNGGDVITWLEALYLTTCSHMSEDPEYREQPDDAMNFATYDNSDEFFWPAYRLLHSIVENGDHQALLSYPAGTDAYTTPRHWERLSPREKYQHDQRLLSSITPDLITLASIEHLQAASLPTRDELTRALFESLTTGAICLWHVLALQLFLDTHHIMRARAADGFTHLERVASHIRASIEQHVQTKHYKLETAAWSSSDHNAFFALRSHVVTWIDDDRIRGALRARGRAVLPPRHNLFRKHPVLCGLFAYVLQMPFHAASVRFADALRSVSSAAHLYNAAIMEGLLAEKWPDMDVAGELQDGIFPGGWPEGVREYVAEYNRAHRDGREALCVGAPVWRAFRERYAGRAANVNLENDVVRKIIAQSLSPKDEDEQGAERADNEEAEVQLVPARLPDFLAKLYLALREEVPEVAFDYLMLHRSCWEILAGVKEKCGDMLKEILGADVVAPQCWKDQEFVPLVTLMAFMAALPPDGPTDREVKMTDEVLDLPIQMAAEKFEQWLEGGKGSEVADAAKKVCRV